MYVYNKEWPSKIPGANFCTFTCNGLSKVDKNNKVNLIMTQSSDTKYSKQNSKEILKNYFHIKNPNNNFNIYRLNYSQKIGKHTGFYFKAVSKIIELNKKEQVDVIITRNTNFLPYLYYLKKRIKAKIYFEAQHFYLAKNLREKNNRKKQYWFQNIFLRLVDGIICLQKVEEKLISDFLPKSKYCVARTGISKIFYNNKPFNNKYIGYIGSLDDSKGVKDLFYAFKEINNKNLYLLIVGGKTEDKVNQYKNLAKKLNILDRLVITGWVNRVKLNNYLKEIKIGIVPARDTFYNRYITSPMKIFDYFSHGIPVIGSDLPTVREIVTGQGGFFYKKGDIKGLASAIDLLASSNSLYEETSNFIFERAKELTWENRGEKLLEFFKE
ncbi:glycosyltransferase [Halanaerobium sp. DL-01]|uniref:glycosyltransferase n=1 Tax=Halanaerobium sp. DL-01 TaxID=1653064 RepID=UPI001F44BDE1|nr:glycosyltransferase [Halanaerobium sp. DL-01]